MNSGEAFLTATPFVVIGIVVTVKIITDMFVSFRFKFIEWKESDLVRKKRSLEEAEKELERKKIDVNRILYRENNLVKKETELNSKKINFESEIRRENLSLDMKISSLRKEQKEFDEQYSVLKKKVIILRERENKIKEMEKELNEKQKVINLTESALECASNSYPPFAKAISDFLTRKQEAYAEFLRTKPRPAFRTADILSETKMELRGYIQKYHEIKYLLDSYETLFPWIVEYREFDIDEILENTAESKIDNSVDPVKMFMSASDYSKLPPVERNQLALERYLSGKKSKWQIGRLYERYIGYRYEQKGYKVSYFGALNGLDDFGRDIIAVKGYQHLIIQCKYWKKVKTIHENVICQLYGSTIRYKIDHSEKDLFGDIYDVHAVLVTSTSCSEMARDFAKHLNVELYENKEFQDYPMIKCNINRNEKIYHLPFDQMYDRVVIEPSKGEFYAKTCAEAEKKGFRRAFRWYGGS